MTASSYSLTSCPVRLVCPKCKGDLRQNSGGIECIRCDARYEIIDGIPDLIVGERYDDDTPDCALCNEEITNQETVERFWAPLFQRDWQYSGSLTILSLGCGVGADVDALASAGWRAVGIDNGKRTAQWSSRRRYPERLISANGKHMPFEDNTFDVIFCGCVFPHVGVEGVTFNTTADFYAQRLELAGELMRVLKPGGRIYSCNPNRFFPFDIFHGHQAGKPVLRPTMPWDRLLLSVGDYRAMFSRRFSVRVTPIANENYWSFTNSRRSVKGRILSAPVRGLFMLVSRVGMLRGSPLNPWLIVSIQKIDSQKVKDAA